MSDRLRGIVLIYMALNLYRVHRAGPREKIYFKPENVKAAIVTCGGLCPGLNDVIRQVIFIIKQLQMYFVVCEL